MGILVGILHLWPISDQYTVIYISLSILVKQASVEHYSVGVGVCAIVR